MTWRIPPHFAWVEATDESVQDVWVLNADRNMIFGISEAAMAIWRACEGAPDVTSVMDRLVADHGWSRDEIADPVEQFVHVLVEQGFLEEAGA